MITDIIAGFISGALGAMGFGGGGILILYLTLFKNTSQLTAQGINLIFFIPSAIVAVLKHKKNKLIDFKISKRYILNGIIGVIVGYFLINTIDENIIKKAFAAILIIFGLKDLFSKNKE